MIIEVGKTYLDRCGVCHTIDRTTQFGAYVNRERALSWNQHGSSYQSRELDLVEEVPQIAPGEAPS